MGAESLAFLNGAGTICQGAWASQTSESIQDLPAMCRKVIELAVGTVTAHNRAMRPLHLAALVVLVGTGACYEAQSTGSTLPEQASWQGPPGGTIDPGWGYEAPDQPGYPAGYADNSVPAGYPEDAATQQPLEPSADPQDPGYVMGDVTDGEIDTTLAPYGSWVEEEGYGRVWRPDATIVGADFTPYETAGSWVYTDYGWTFACDWDWGWLPFHYGRWAYFDDSWGWVPDHTWGPAWVDWREGGGYVGWRPRAPDVRGGSGRLVVRDHRRGPRDEWHYTQTANLGRPHIRDHIVSVPDGDRITTHVAHPPGHGALGGRAATVMSGRLDARYGALGTYRGPQRPAWNQPARTAGQPTFRQPPTRTSTQLPRELQQPTWQRHRPARSYPQPTYRQPSDRQPPVQAYQPQRTYPPGDRQQTYQPPQRAYPPPVRTSSPGFRAPPTSSYSAPSRAYSPPSRAYSPPPAPSRSSSPAPSRSSSPSSNAPSSGSRSSGGGRDHRR